MSRTSSSEPASSGTSDEDSFEHWWDLEHIERTNPACPHSPGMLPPLVSRSIRAAHAPALLARVTIHPPERAHVWGTMEPIYPVDPPTLQDWVKARPHKDALYSFDTNSWVILSVRSKRPLPHISTAQGQASRAFLRASVMRMDAPLCSPGVLPEDRDPRAHADLDASYRPHHYHGFPGAVAFELSHTASEEDLFENSPTYDWEVSRTPAPLDLYVCCACSTHILVSERIPGIVPSELFDKLRTERGAQPRGAPGQTVEDRILRAVETILSIVQNLLWRGCDKHIRNNSTNFHDRIGHTPTVQQIFEALNFVWEPELLRPPDLRGDEGAANRTMLLRAWVEIRAWISEYRVRYGTRIRRTDLPPFVVTQDATPLYETAIGATRFQIERHRPPGNAIYEADDYWIALGMTQDTYTPDLVEFAYTAQLKCDPQRTPLHFTNLEHLYRAAYDEADPTQTDQLRDLIYAERQRGRWNAEDLQDALRTLGLHRDTARGLRVSVDLDCHSLRRGLRSVHEAVCEAAFRHAMLLADADGGSDNMHVANLAVRRATLRDALSVIAEHLGSYRLKALAARNGEVVSVAAAYLLLGVSPDADDDMVCIAYRMPPDLNEVVDQSKRREALQVIAHTRDSARLRKLVATGDYGFRTDEA